ncbi:MAG TPA: hypothetical protein VF157_15955 [Chloroflexota bacterium]
MAQRREVSLGSLSWGLYPGAILWGFQLWVSYGLVNVSCGHGFDLMFHLVSLVFAVLTGLTVLLSYRLWRDIRAGELISRGTPGRAEFMALSGMAANSLFVLLIVIGGIPSFIFDPCVA